MKANGLPLPGLLVDLIREGRWVQPTSEAIRIAFPNLGGGIEFYSGVDRFEAATNHMKELANHPQVAETLCMYRSSSSGEERDLPWLDLDRAVLLCDSAEIGDDVGVALDYRGGGDDPRVVASAWAGRKNQWSQLTERFSDFVQALGL